VQAEVRYLPAEIEVEDPGFDPRQPLVGVDLENVVELGGHDHEGIVDRGRTAGEAGPAPPGHERSVVARRDADCLDDLAPGTGKADHRGAASGDARVARVERELQWFGARLIGAEHRLEVAEERACVVDGPRL
jgi:hypothetical protein